MVLSSGAPMRPKTVGAQQNNIIFESKLYYYSH